MPSHRAQTPPPRLRTDRPDISQRRQIRPSAPVQAGYDAVHAGYDAAHAGYDAVQVGYDAGHPGYDAGHPGYDPYVAGVPQYATFAPAALLGDRPALQGYDPAPFVGFENDGGYAAPQRSFGPPPSDGYDLFDGVFASPAALAAPASVVKGGPQQPMTRAQLRAAEGPLTNRSARRQADRADRSDRSDRADRATRAHGARPAATRISAPVKRRPTQTTKAPRRGRGGLSLPQVGVAGALGLATIAAPLTGALSVPAVKQAAEPMPITAVSAPSVAFPRMAAQEANAVEEAKLVPGANDSSSLPSTLTAPRTILVTRASRDSERAVLPGCDGRVPVGATWRNGQIPTKELCTLWERDHMLRADAAVALAKLNIAYNKRFGRDICMTDSYRTLAAQRTLKANKPSLAAVPGTSNHGWGVAVDLCDSVEDYNSTTYSWMRANAPAYGWENPDWALPGGGGPFEPWHWEFMPGEQVGPGSD